MGYIDSHAHILDASYDDVDKIIENAKNEGVKKIEIICCEFDQIAKAIELASASSMFEVAAGIHPSDVKKYDNSKLAELEDYLKLNKLNCLGEIGLDYHWDKDNKEEQKDFFIKQIELANKYNLPVSIHSRDAILDTYNILKDHPVKRKGIIHCYSSSLEMAKEFIKLGYLIGVGGVVTFKNSKVLKEVVKGIDTDNIIIETDCPYLAPVPKRGKQNQPAYISHTYQAVADLKEIDLKTLKMTCEKNYHNLFDKD